MRKKTLIVFFAVCVLACLIVVPEAQAAGKGKYWCESEKYSSKGLDEMLFKKCHFILMNKEELGLSEEQVDKVVALKTKAKKDNIMKEAEIEALAIDVKAELWKDEIDLNAVNKLIDTKYDLKKQNAKNLVASYAELKKILSESQMDKLKELWKKCEAGEQHGMMMGEGMGHKGQMMKR